MVLNILQVGDPILRQIAQEVQKEDITSQKIKDYIADMKETMYAAPGVGLAATQVGIPLQIIVIEDCEKYLSTLPSEIRKERERYPVPFHVIINPKITVTSEENAFFFEGCLSVNGCARITPRAKSVRVECLDENGNEKIIHANGWYARILQHEIDHLMGKLFIDRSDKRTEIGMNEYSKKWLNASAKEIQDFLQNHV